jgi:hypothetical protein
MLLTFSRWVPIGPRQGKVELQLDNCRNPEGRPVGDGARLLARDLTRRHAEVAAFGYAINACIVLAIGTMGLGVMPLVAAMCRDGLLGGLIIPSRDMRWLAVQSLRHSLFEECARMNGSESRPIFRRCAWRDRSACGRSSSPCTAAPGLDSISPDWWPRPRDRPFAQGPKAADRPLQPAEDMPQHRSEHTSGGKTSTDGSPTKGICSNAHPATLPKKTCFYRHTCCQRQFP